MEIWGEVGAGRAEAQAEDLSWGSGEPAESFLGCGGHHSVGRSEQMGAQVLGPVDIKVHRWPVDVGSMGAEGSPRMLQKPEASPRPALGRGGGSCHR